MKTKDFSYFIERHISFEMTESERQWFLKEMENNPDLRREVDLRKKSDEILKKQSIMSLRIKLSELENNRRKKEMDAVVRRMAILKYVAAFVGVAIITSLILFTGKTLTSEEIVNQFYQAYEAPSFQRSSSTDTNSEYILGLKYYNAQDYRNAASQFAKVLEKNPNDMQTHLLSGVSKMEEKKYNDAKKSFTTVIDDKDNLFIESAKWYLALCYLKTEENDRASELLGSISKEGGLYRREAKKILRKIK
jgi:tetratricopeptide (TPR) repeat protein